MRSYSRSAWRLYSARWASPMRRPGRSLRIRSTADWIRWMLVDSSGSRKPLASPTAMTLACQKARRLPGVKRSGRGSASAGAVEIGEKLRRRFVVGQCVARIDNAVAGAVLERDAPLPAGRVRGGAGIGGEVFRARARHRECAVAGQPVRPVLVADAERVGDQQAAKAGAIDEQVARDAAFAVERAAQ